MADSLLVWPRWMPKPQRNGYGYDPVDRRERTEMEVGSVLRVKYDTDETTLNCTLILDQFQLAWFESFEHSVLSQGSQWFEMPIQTGGSIENHVVRMKTRPKYGQLIGLYTTVTLQLDVEKRNLICGGLARLLMCMSPQEIITLHSLVHTAVHLSIPPLKIPEFWMDKRPQRGKNI